MDITAQMVKELRDRTGAGMMDCKKALKECNGDIDSAIDMMRKAGQAKADKKSSRVAAEGVIDFLADKEKNNACLVEVNCETDFVAKDENFLNFVSKVSSLSLSNFTGNIDEFVNQKINDGKSLEELRLELVSKVGENVQIRRIKVIEGNNGHIGSYLHGKKIGVVICLSDKNEDLAKDIAMHIAAMKPIAIQEKDISKDIIDKERDIYLAQASESGKPKEIIEKMVDGKLKKFLNEVTLLSQQFVKDPDTSIGALLEKSNCEVLDFFRYEVGEGIDKKEENFAEEVMSQIKN
ncbi:MAG: translation elongation factor Ts [Pseudomonadota bacterium]|nr:translation elongation factor Ts [Pseudomonadota bacterium]